MGLGLFAISVAVFTSFVPCHRELEKFRTQMDRHSVSLDTGFLRSKPPQQRRILKAFDIQRLPSLDRTFWQGFWFLQNKIGIHRIGVSLLKQRRQDLGREKIGREERLLRIHPGALIPLCKSIGVLFRYAVESPYFDLTRLNEALDRIKSEIDSKRRIDFANGILGYFEEIRAAAFLVEQGYILHEIGRIETGSDEKDFEIDLVISEPSFPEKLIIVEVKSTLKASSRTRPQLKRYKDILSGKLSTNSEYTSGILFVTKNRPSEKSIADFEESNPGFKVMHFPEDQTTKDVYPFDEF